MKGIVKGASNYIIGDIQFFPPEPWMHFKKGLPLKANNNHNIGFVSKVTSMGPDKPIVLSVKIKERFRKMIMLHKHFTISCLDKRKKNDNKNKS